MNFNGIFSSIGSYTSLIVAAPFFIIGLIFVFVGVRAKSQSARVRNAWKTAPGQVMFSEVAQEQMSDEGGWTTYYYPRVVYEYRVNGIRYQGTKITAGKDRGLGTYEAAHTRIMQQYAPGRQLQVYYNPANLSEAVLEADAPRGTTWIVIGVAILVLITLGTVCMSSGMGLLDQLFGNLPIEP